MPRPRSLPGRRGSTGWTMRCRTTPCDLCPGVDAPGQHAIEAPPGSRHGGPRKRPVSIACLACENGGAPCPGGPGHPPPAMGSGGSARARGSFLRRTAPPACTARGAPCRLARAPPARANGGGQCTRTRCTTRHARHCRGGAPCPAGPGHPPCLRDGRGRARYAHGLGARGPKIFEKGGPQPILALLRPSHRGEKILKKSPPLWSSKKRLACPPAC